MNNKSKAANPGLLVMALLLVLLALVVVLIAVILATGNKENNQPKDTEAQDTTTTVQNILNSSVPDTTLPDDPVTTTTSGITTTTNNTPNTGAVTTTTNNVTPNTTTPNTGTSTPNYGKSTISVSSSQKNQGALIRVDGNHPADFREKFPTRSELKDDRALLREMDLVVISPSNNYGLPATERYLNSVAVQYFYKMMETFQQQNETGDKVYLRNAYYCDYTEDNPHANISVTGYAIDLQIYDSKGLMNSLKSDSSFYGWFIENCADYGFIHCGDTSAYSSFRFVGTAHAGCMEIYSLNFEEYLEYISKKTADSCLRITDEFGVEWWVYYVKASDGENTEITVYGDESCYEISGDNIGGFVVTINASKLG